ncbi:SLAM family member 5-like isoform X1 [Pantherophis guttatus]|uniref:SLAM family member 5-like isoform X1 n=1 Tax=Pantherophis guttatus TaxID=94885 RepID=A0A6P9CJ24_PANGU|nr:SLAM family member 5-like isoform X1 [Pantherophis guttatus]XP_060538583.1 SLAM family member 5-like isoform X1 [Pantherophis guttatus]XP_060538584.1 SLAM family member 5-like isoform X1 [Pantherophis guttatus]XP_060538585.1 SLAM family member 5-like isoform X1 [Pantherophis guttatus]
MPVADMSHNRLLRLWFPILLFGTGASGAENGVLGESVTFQVKISTPFEIIFWTKIVGGESRNISVVTFGKPCGLLVPLQDFQKRVNISKDCSKLLLRHLKKDDAGRYSAKIISQNNKVEDVSFELHVYRRLLGSQLRVTCVPDGAGSETWQLHCSTETWEEGTELSWTSATQNMDPTLGNSVTKLIYRDGDLNVTCTARNRVSWASKTVSLKQVCAGASGIEELTGILGASITFQVKTSPPYEKIFWSKMDGNKSIDIVKVIFAEPCGFQVFLPAFQNRVNVSKDCRELYLSHLKQEDASRYSAQIVLPNQKTMVEFFDLQVSHQSCSGLSLWAVLFLSKVGSLLLLGCLGLILRKKSRKADGGRRLLAQFLSAFLRSQPPPPPWARACDHPSSTLDPDGRLPPTAPLPDSHGLPQRHLRRFFGTRSLPFHKGTTQ